MSIFYIFLSKECRAVSDALELIGTELKHTGTFSFDKYNAVDIVLSRANDMMHASKKSINSQIREKRLSPETMAWNLIAQASQIVSTGQFHYYRGKLNSVGHELLSFFRHSLDQLVKNGFITEKQAQDWKENVNDDIQMVG
jgi:hypothetical protein